MEGVHEIYLARDTGVRLLDGPLALTRGFIYTNTVNDAGHFTLDLPAGFDPLLLRAGDRVEFWYTPPGWPPCLDFLGYISAFDYAEDAGGSLLISVEGADAVGHILAGRVIAANAGADEATVDNDYADDAMKALVRANFGASAGTGRVVSAAYFDAAADVSLGPQVTRSLAGMTVLDALRELADAARGAGTAVYFWIARRTDALLEFRTSPGCPGADRRASVSSAPTLFSQARGNLLSPALRLDYGEEINAALVRGQGPGVARAAAWVADTTRAGRGLLARREGVVDTDHEGTAAGLETAGDAALVAGRPSRRFSATLVNAGATVYGRDWNVGDRVSAEAFGRTFEGLVKSRTVRRDGQGLAVEARLELEDQAWTS